MEAKEFEPAAASAVPSTVEEARRAHRLENALQSTRRRLSKLQQEQQKEYKIRGQSGRESGRGIYEADIEPSIDDMELRDQPIGLVSESEFNSTEFHVDVAPTYFYRAMSSPSRSPSRASPSGSMTPKTINPAMREALLTLARDKSKVVLPKNTKRILVRLQS